MVHARITMQITFNVKGNVNRVVHTNRGFDMSLTQAQNLIDDKFPNQYRVLPSESLTLALQTYEDKLATSRISNDEIARCAANFARLYLTEVLGIDEGAISKAVRRAELRVEKIKVRIG